MKDIAARANVSIGTVSRVLNRHQDVDEKLRVRVEAVARKLGYRLNSANTRRGAREIAHHRAYLVQRFWPEFCAIASLARRRRTLRERRLLSAVCAASVSRGPAARKPADSGRHRNSGLGGLRHRGGQLLENILAAFAHHGLNYVLLANHVLGCIGEQAAFCSSGALRR